MKDKIIIIYDFDGTLTSYPRPKFELLEKCGLKEGLKDPLFQDSVKKIIEKDNLDFYDAFYQAFLSIIKESGYSLNDDNFSLGATSIKYNKGVLEFFQNLKQYNIDNYILSSGLKVFLERTSIAPLVNGIYATVFTYDENSLVNGIEFLMSDKNKVFAIKDIMKKYNYTDCSNIIYIGDGLTDVYAMEYVKNNGGTTIFVYQDKNDQGISAMKEKGIVSFYTLADFSPNGELYSSITKLNKLEPNHIL